ncbi:MAG: hypothetical protein ACO1TE_03745 [Prosthecobacter sp.]
MIELPVVILCLASFFAILVDGCDRTLEREGRNPWLDIGKLMACWILATLVTILYWQGIIYLMVQGLAYSLIHWKYALHFSLMPVLWLSYRCFKRLLLGAAKRKDEQGEKGQRERKG